MNSTSNEQRLVDVRRWSFYSAEDQMLMARVVCDDCGRQYEEGLRGAEAKAVTGCKMLCISCDKEAEKPALFRVRMTVWVYW